MKYLLKKEFIKEADTSKSTLYKFYKKYPNLMDETKLVRNRRLIPTAHMKYFSTEAMLEDSIRKEEKIEELKSFLDHIRNCEPDDFRLSLWRADWDIFGTISYKYELSRSHCERKLRELFRHLEHHFLHKTNLRMFFNTEQYELRGGHHNHFIMHCSNPAILKDVKESIKQFFSYDRVDLQPYDKYRPATFYICKDGLNDEDWDDLEF
ncbi:hypothetical protein [Salegentibacter mishustinae]|uniref:hypothetical protein n=1 Tax=Salegentibacter mishustinae TaxID=270918 RepID=UPI00248FE9F1|nr:hypothetical protein [Salegentibacter mishustinae]